MLANRYLRSVDINDISNGVVQSYQFNQAPSVPALPSPSPSPSPSPPPPQTTNHSSPGAGRKLLYNGIRKLSQTPWTSTLITGVILRVQVLTNAMRVQSEVTTLVNAIDSGMLASDLQLALGMEITNISFTQQPVSSPYNMVTTSSPAGSLPTWAIGVIVGVILILLPIPLYILYRRRRKSHISALEKQQAEAAAARQRMQSRILKTGGKMFSKGRSPYGSAYNVGAAQGLPGDAILLEQAKSSMPGGSPSSRVTESLSSDGDSCRDSISSNASFRMERYSQSMADGVANMEANRALYYQQQSIGRTMPHRSPPFGLSRPPGSNVDVSARYQHPGRVNVRYGSTYPLRYPTEEASTSSGNLSDRR